MPGAWAGSIIHSDGGQLHVMVFQDRLENTKTFIAWMAKQLGGAGGLSFKPMEWGMGYLIYIRHTYPTMVPYLKGIYLMLDSWCPWRKDDGWKMLVKEIQAALAIEQEEEDWNMEEETEVKRRNAPTSVVQAVPYMKHDVHALKQLA